MPAHCTAVGKAMFAHAPMALTRSIVDSGLRRRSPRTILAPNLFLGQLEGVRRRGFARDVEESAVGISCVAAPVFGADGRPVVAISVIAWAHSLHPTRCVQAVRSTASAASQAFHR